jgi:hypothetical protein
VLDHRRDRADGLVGLVELPGLEQVDEPEPDRLDVEPLVGGDVGRPGGPERRGQAGLQPVGTLLPGPPGDQGGGDRGRVAGLVGQLDGGRCDRGALGDVAAVDERLAESGLDPGPERPVGVGVGERGGGGAQQLDGAVAGRARPAAGEQGVLVAEGGRGQGGRVADPDGERGGGGAACCRRRRRG